ncbi:MAG: hypothetical protein A2Z95_04725 [Gallionellales bacterium GWA2_60_18]|nr:MAG: hypothetical protein A2Z95_04725 [Gallionellales bacterium GWA2_60_18]
MFAQPSIAILNHLLAQNSWALPRLARFAGKIVRFDIAPFSCTCTVLPDGLLDAADEQASADAVCTISPALLPRLALRDGKADADIRTEGDAALLEEVFFLWRNLRWDAAEDLSAFTGDIAAERIVQAAQAMRRQVRDTALNLAQAAAEYATEERPLLSTPRQLAAFAQEVRELRDDMAHLEQRIQNLSSSLSTSHGKEQ